MNIRIIRPGTRAVIGLVISLPTAYLIVITLLKYVFKAPVLYDAAAPVLEAWGSKDALGWNINLLILFGPLIALLLNLSSVLSLDRRTTRDGIPVRWRRLRRRRANWMAIGVSGICILALFIYLLNDV